MKKPGLTLEEILEEEALISKAVNEAMDEVEKQLEDEEDESPEISEITGLLHQRLSNFFVYSCYENHANAKGTTHKR